MPAKWSFDREMFAVCANEKEVVAYVVAAQKAGEGVL